jgi:hypothetical protein
MKIFENRLLRGIFGPKREGVTGAWRELRNMDLHNVYFLPDITRYRTCYRISGSASRALVN